MAITKRVISHNAGLSSKPAHELGHILAAQHMATQFQNPVLTEYAYHNQEALYRRNQAYGRAVSQHDLKFFTLMAYSSYKNENNARRGCLDCTQFPVYLPRLVVVF